MTIVRIILALIAAVLKVFVDVLVDAGALIGSVVLIALACAGVVWVVILIVLSLFQRRNSKQ